MDDDIPIVSLRGWSLVHTYRDAHGSFVTKTYQKDTLVAPRLGNREVELLHITEKLQNKGEPLRIRTESSRLGQYPHDYALAKYLRGQLADVPEALRFVLDVTSPCATAGHTIYYDTMHRLYYEIASVAGHGEWAFPVSIEDVVKAGGVRVAGDDD